MARNQDSAKAVTAGILAGGTARRLGGVDKGWVTVAGQSLIEHTIDRLRRQCGSILINANQNLSDYRRLGPEVHPDPDGPDRGPLAGIETLLRLAPTDRVLIVPVDTPLLPTDLTSRLNAALDETIDIAVARTPSGLQRLHAIMHRRCLDHLVSTRTNDVHSVDEWQAGLKRREVEFVSNAHFLNLNTPADIAAAEQQLQPK